MALSTNALGDPARETWRAVVGYEGRYEVSDQGRVRSIAFRRGGKDWARRAPYVLKGVPNPDGYLQYRLGRGRAWFGHLLVLEAFGGPRPPGHEGAHENGHPGDNRLENLAWKTKVENERDKVRHGTLQAGDRHYARSRPEQLARGDRHGMRLHPERQVRGEAHGKAKLTAALVIEIRAAAANGEPQRAIAARHGVHQRTIGLAVRRATWVHVGTSKEDAR